MLIRSLSLLVLCAVLYQCHAKPAQLSLDPPSLVQQQVVPAVVVYKREQRSPQFGFPEGEFDDERRPNRHKQHHVKRQGCFEYPCGEYPEYPPPGGIPPPFLPPPGGIPPPFPPPLGGILPPPGAIAPFPAAYPQPYPEGGSGGSSASASSNTNNGGGLSNGQSQASAQSGNSYAAGGNPYTDGQSQSNAQSASFNFGPYSATFSKAESSSSSDSQDY
ncbi:hypothetical protein ANTRET_LOCUS10467 [Anthophora retusa]